MAYVLQVQKLIRFTHNDEVDLTYKHIPAMLPNLSKNLEPPVPTNVGVMVTVDLKWNAYVGKHYFFLST